MVTEDRLDNSLRALAEPRPAPVMSAELEDMLNEVRRVSTRNPRREVAAIGFVSLLYAGGLVVLTNLRPDMGSLPLGFVLAFAIAWLLGFGALLWLALVPAQGAVSPRWKNAVGGTALTGLLFPMAGLFIVQVGDNSVVSTGSTALFLHHADQCLRFGLMTAVVPIVLATLVLRRAVPVRSRAVAAALGASGGTLGGFALHMHCNVADGLHVGLVHGGQVVLCAALAALVLPRFLEPR